MPAHQHKSLEQSPLFFPIAGVIDAVRRSNQSTLKVAESLCQSRLGACHHAQRMLTNSPIKGGLQASEYATEHAEAHEGIDIS